MTPEQNIADLMLALPQPAKPVANYVPFVISGNLIFVSGQVSTNRGGLIKGRLGDTMSIEEGQVAAQACGLNLLAQCKAAIGDLSMIARVVKLGGFVNATPDFEDVPTVINGCSDLMVNVFGEAGRHARFAVGSPVLPMGVAVEIDGIFEIKP